LRLWYYKKIKEAIRKHKGTHRKQSFMMKKEIMGNTKADTAYRKSKDYYDSL
jgi:hypothetical protein